MIHPPKSDEEPMPGSYLSTKLIDRNPYRTVVLERDPFRKLRKNVSQPRPRLLLMDGGSALLSDQSPVLLMG